MFADLSELAAYLAAAQEERTERIRCELTQGLSARISDAALLEALVTGLPMVQGIQHRILRSRGKGAVLTAKLHYRDGVRLLAHWRNGDATRSTEEAAALDTARSIANEAAVHATQEARFRHLFDWVSRNIRYAHTAPGLKGYERLIGAAAVLTDKTANCQGYADVMYLLCGLCGIDCQYRCGKGERRLHVWNVVYLNGEWQEADASRTARRLQEEQSSPALPGILPEV